MNLTFKYRLFPSNSQRTSLKKSLAACCFVYNQALETRKDAWETHKKKVGRYDTINMIPGWKHEHSFLRDAFSQCLQEACVRVDLAFRSFFRRVKAGDKPGYPRFKSLGRYDSFTYTQSGFRLLDNGRLRLSKIGDVKIKLHRQIRGEVRTLTVRRDSVGNWYACFSCSVQPRPLPFTDKVVGIDLGLTTFAYFSNGKKIKRKRWMKRDSKDIARLQRKREQFPKGSKKRERVTKALRHAYQRQSNRRKDFAHKESRKLVNEYQFISLEDLDISGMQSNGNRTINRGIADVAWARFVQYTVYKAEDAGRSVVLVNPKNTTQECSGCGKIVPKGLSVRKHECFYCGLSLDRDHNAALNILARGLASLG
jgi:putative transposase